MIENIEKIKAKKGFICDMDGVIYHGNILLNGVKEFVNWLNVEKKSYVFLTNSSSRTPKELSNKLKHLGIDVDESRFYTSALATASFLASQKPHGSAFVIGDPGIINALYNVGYTLNSVNPDYVIVSETSSYTYETLKQAINLVLAGSKLIGTNPDLTGPGENEIVPATKALIAPIELSTGRSAYFIGKPNPLMMRSALKKIDCEPEETIIIGDRMDTDIIAGIESEIQTALVLTGITTIETMNMFPYRPDYVLNGVIDLV